MFIQEKGKGRIFSSQISRIQTGSYHERFSICRIAEEKYRNCSVKSGSPIHGKPPY